MADAVAHADLEPIARVPETDEEFLNEVLLALQWVGFTAEESAAINEEIGLLKLEDLLAISEDDLKDMATAFSRRTIADGRIIFGLRKTLRLVGLRHYVADCHRCSRVSSIFGVPHRQAFMVLMDSALRRDKMRKIDAEQEDTISKMADPGKFKDERKWPEWEPAFVNYLSTLQGTSGVPLSYVVRKNIEPDHTTDYGEDFTAECVACCPLEGAEFSADARKVHQVLKNFLVAETADQWVKPLEKFADGRRDMMALRAHYSGEGNASRRAATADNMRETLFYKSERALPFSSFLDRMQKMFNIYEEEGEALEEKTKLRELFKRVKHPELKEAVKAIEVRHNLDGMTYSSAANLIAAEVSKLPEFQMRRKLGSVKAGDVKKKGKGGKKKEPTPRLSILNDDGTVFTGYYPNWKEFGHKEQAQVLEERKKRKENGYNKKATGKRKADQVSAMQSDLQLLKTAISALTASAAAAAVAPVAEVGAATPTGTGRNAGNAFGGRAAQAN